MKSKTPALSKVINGIILFRLILTALTVIIFASTEGVTNPFFAGIRSGISDSFGVDDKDHLTALGRIIGWLLIPTILIILIWVFVSDKKFPLAIGLSVLDIITGLGAGLPILQIVLLILLIAHPKPKKPILKQSALVNVDEQKSEPLN